MSSVRLYLDLRTPKKNGMFPLKLSVSRKSTRCFISLDIELLAEQFDESGGKNGRTWVVNHSNKDFYNRFLARRISDVEEIVFRKQSEGSLAHISSAELRSIILQELSPEESDKDVRFISVYKKFMEGKGPRSKELYEQTLGKIKSYTNSSLLFTDITFEWLTDFESYLSETIATNTISIHMRNIRAVFNYALDLELISCYPFRRYKIKREATIKRSLTAEQLVMLRDYQCEPHQIIYRDLFMLTFYLIGINSVDLLSAKKKDVYNNRLEYRRHKTKKLYSIFIPKEAQEIIDRYAGEDYLLNIMESYSNYKDFLHRWNINLQQIGEVNISGRGGRKNRTPLFPNLTTYWARHTWATIAHKIGISKDVISMSLGHELNGSKVTDIYIDYDSEKVDIANRKVIDYLEQM